MNRADVILFEAKQTRKVLLLFRWLVDMLTTILWKTTFGEPLKDNYAEADRMTSIVLKAVFHKFYLVYS